MITFLLVFILLILIAANVAMVFLIRSLLYKISVYEQWVTDCRTRVVEILDTMRAIDVKGTFATSLNDKGTFESDDQVGQVFKDLLELVEILNEYVK